MMLIQIVWLVARKHNVHRDKEKTLLEGNIPIEMNFYPY
jgi:hypothetical protein